MVDDYSKSSGLEISDLSHYTEGVYRNRNNNR